jgi:Fe-S cluster assembly protein SufB
MTDRKAVEIAEDGYKYGFHDDTQYIFRTEKGLSRKVVQQIAGIKEEPEWMREMRLRALEIFESKPMPGWGPDLSAVNLDEMYYYARASDRAESDWSEVPDQIRRTFDRLGIPEAERKFLAGVGAQYDSETVYHNIREELSKQGVIFVDMDTAVREHPELVRRYFGTVVPAGDNKFSALNSAVWSGGSFIYVPEGVRVDVPLQAYFRINAENIGQFERTLIIAEPGSFVHYIEGCTAPIYTSNSLHAAVVEVIVKKGARVRYSTVQNWSTNVYNLVTKRSVAYEDAIIEWVDGNLGSKVTMKYPAIYLMEPGARGEVLSLSFAGRGQHQDAGAKAVHVAPYTNSVITSKSISKDGGRSSYRGLVKVYRGAKGIRSSVRCDALILDEDSRSDTYPTMEIDERDVTVSHEASVSKVSEEQLFYLRSRGIDEQEATKMIVNGFVEPVVKELPMEYAVELNRLIELQLEGAVG